MTDDLFDATPYRDPSRKPPRQSRRANPPLNLVENDGSWVALARYEGRPHDFAHQVIDTSDGLATAACDVYGRRLDIPAGYKVNACPKCQAEMAKKAKKERAG